MRTGSACERACACTLVLGICIGYSRSLSYLTYHNGDFGDDIQVAANENKDDILDNALSKPFDQGGLATPGFMSLVASFEGYLNVYKDTKLAWTAKM